MTDQANAPYMKYLDSKFFTKAITLCPYEHPREMFCSVCREITLALEEVYEQGRSDEKLRMLGVITHYVSDFLGE